MIVAIHYRSGFASTPNTELATINELSQEFLLGAISSVAVPMLLLLAGYLVFRATRCSKNEPNYNSGRCLRIIALPYFIISSISLVSWVMISSVEGETSTMGLREFLTLWLLNPPAEQLWILRDLMVLVLITPLIRVAVDKAAPLLLVILAALWAFQVEPFPRAGLWHLIRIESFFFYALGGWCLSRSQTIESMRTLSWGSVIGLLIVWIDLCAMRVFMQPNFFIGTENSFTIESLLIHKIAIVVGCVAMFSLAWKITGDWIARASHIAFFVFLAHEFPIRPVLESGAERIVDPTVSFWIATPLALTGCYAMGVVIHRFLPRVFELMSLGQSTPVNSTLTTRGQAA